MPLIHRRAALLGLGSLLAAPAVVKASSLMPVKVMEPTLAYPEARELVWIAKWYSEPTESELAAFRQEMSYRHGVLRTHVARDDKDGTLIWVTSTALIHERF